MRRTRLELMALGGLTLGVLVLTTIRGDSFVIVEIQHVLHSTEYGYAALHAALFATLTWVWYRSGKLWLPTGGAVVLAASVALMIGTATELAQLIVPERGATLLDLGANWLGTLGVAAFVWLRAMHQMPANGAPSAASSVRKRDSSRPT